MISITKGKWGVLSTKNYDNSLTYLVHNGSIGYFMRTSYDFKVIKSGYWEHSLLGLLVEYPELTLVSEEDTLEEAKAVIKMILLME